MKISVVTVCFNSEKTLERTLRSFVQQDFPNKELIVVDGSSNDGTQDIIQRYKDHIAVIICEPDKGIYDAMNKGWRNATGDFVHFLNSDDWYVTPHVLSTVAKQIGNTNTIYHGRLIYKHSAGHETKMGRPFKVSDLKYELRGIHQPATFFPRHMFEKWGGFDLRYKISSDYELIRRFVEQAPTKFLDLDVTNMSDSGASAKQISTALKENFAIAVHYGESPLMIHIRNMWVRFWLMVRYNFPFVFRYLKLFKDRFSISH